MRKYQIIFILLFIVIYIGLFYLKSNSSKKERDVYLSDLNISIIDIPKKIFVNPKDIVKTNYSLWDIDINKIMLERKRLEDAKRLSKKRKNRRKISNSSSIIEDGAKIKKRIICLHNKCWEFMGMISIDNKKVVTLLSREKKDKLKVFKVGDKLLDNLIITNIKEDSLTISDEKKREKFILKLFDINLSAYHQKNIKVSTKDRNE